MGNRDVGDAEDERLSRLIGASFEERLPAFGVGARTMMPGRHHISWKRGRIQASGSVRVCDTRTLPLDGALLTPWFWSSDVVAGNADLDEPRGSDS